MITLSIFPLFVLLHCLPVKNLMLHRGLISQFGVLSNVQLFQTALTFSHIIINNNMPALHSDTL